MKTRRMTRYKFLRQSGFLKQEAFVLSKVPLRIPYFDVIIKERYKQLVEAIKTQSLAKFEKAIKQEYVDEGWIRKRRFDVWMMFRAYEDRYRRKFPQYESPWERRRVALKDFVKSTESTINKHYRDWIKQLDVSIANAKTPERKAG